MLLTFGRSNLASTARYFARAACSSAITVACVCAANRQTPEELTESKSDVRGEEAEAHSCDLVVYGFVQYEQESLLPSVLVDDETILIAVVGES